MATTREATFGTVRCIIHTRHHVQVGDSVSPAVATAAANGSELTDEKGLPIELTASTEEEAAARMSRYLEKRFGSES